MYHCLLVPGSEHPEDRGFITLIFVFLISSKMFGTYVFKNACQNLLHGESFTLEVTYLKFTLDLHN